MDITAPQPTSHALIGQFRNFLRQLHGAAAVEVPEYRLNGDVVKELIGPSGLETSYRLKQVVQAIK